MTIDFSALFSSPEFWAFGGALATGIFNFLLRLRKSRERVELEIEKEQHEWRKELKRELTEALQKVDVVSKKNELLASKILILSAKMIYLESLLTTHNIEIKYPARIKQLELELIKGEIKINGNGDSSKPAP